MDLAKLKEKYVRSIAFHRFIAIQETLPRGSPQDIKQELNELVQVGKPRSGFIIYSPQHSSRRATRKHPVVIKRLSQV